MKRLERGSATALNVFSSSPRTVEESNMTREESGGTRAFERNVDVEAVEGNNDDDGVLRRIDNSKWQSPPGSSSNRGSASSNPFTRINLMSTTSPNPFSPTPSSRYSLEPTAPTPASSSRKEQLVKKFQAHVQILNEERPKESWAVAVQEFLDYGMALGIASAGATPATNAAMALTPASTIATVAPTPKTPFSFGSPPVASTTPAAAVPTPAATTVPTPAATSTPVAASAITPATKPTPAATAPTPGAAAVATPGSDDYIEFYQVSAIHRKMNKPKDGWSRHKAGSLKLRYKPGVAKSKSIVIRDEVTGLVQAVWNLPEETKLSMIQISQKKQRMGIQFLYADKESGMNAIQLFCNDIDELSRTKMMELRDKQV